MRFISWNVNGLRACIKKGFFDFLSEYDPDILAIQETKMQRDQLEHEFPNYHHYMNDALKKGYSGTMILAKFPALNVSYDIKGEHPKEGRVITLEFEEFYFVNAYVPNSKDGLLRLDYRMQFEDDLRAHLVELDKHKPVIYCGDLNVAHNEIDLKNPKTNHFNPGFSDEEREKFSILLDSGFIDTFRHLYPERVKYSWWSYRSRSREKNVGWRIDYFVVSKRLIDRIKEADILNEVYGSDHCPVLIEYN